MPSQDTTMFVVCHKPGALREFSGKSQGKKFRPEFGNPDSLYLLNAYCLYRSVTFPGRESHWNFVPG